MIRVALGEVSYVGYANPDNFSYPEIMIAVLSTMLAEWRPGPDEIGEVFEKASILLAERMAQVPELAEAASRTGDVKLLTATLEWLSERTRVTPTEWALGIEARRPAIGEHRPLRRQLLPGRHPRGQGRIDRFCHVAHYKPSRTSRAADI